LKFLIKIKNVFKKKREREREYEMSEYLKLIKELKIKLELLATWQTRSGEFLLATWQVRNGEDL